MVTEYDQQSLSILKITKTIHSIYMYHVQSINIVFTTVSAIISHVSSLYGLYTLVFEAREEMLYEYSGEGLELG